MTIQENRDDIITRIIEQRKQCSYPPRTFLPSKEVREIEEYVKGVIMPKTYEGKDTRYTGGNRWLRSFTNQ